LNENLDFVAAALPFLPFQLQSFDLVMVIGVFHHLPDFSGLGAMRKIMTADGVSLIHEVVVNNPVAQALVGLAKLFPASLKSKLLDVADGKIPKVRPFTSGLLRDAIQESGLILVDEEREQLFLFLLWYILSAFPSIAPLVPRSLLDAFWSLEQHLDSRFPTRTVCRFVRFTAMNRQTS
jgi:hypothetical protein